MSDNFFAGSDEGRNGGGLPHARFATFDDGLALEKGGQLPSVTVAYETYGELNATKSNAVLICHALTGDSHVARHTPDDTPGWWDIMVGPGKPIDTDRYFVWDAFRESDPPGASSVYGSTHSNFTPSAMTYSSASLLSSTYSEVPPVNEKVPR